MNPIQKELEGAFKLLERIPVSYGNVEIMAEAKAKMRNVYAMLEQSEEVTPDADDRTR